ncbi:putative phosphoheptose isomerase [Mycobacterium xenopi 3993]|nr:putative phosphoheptose isomerase [Mycobacterium xenopi 3993]
MSAPTTCASLAATKAGSAKWFPNQRAGRRWCAPVKDRKRCRPSWWTCCRRRSGTGPRRNGNQQTGCIMTDEATNFLYPFIDAQERDADSLLGDLAASAEAKAAESLALRRSTLEENAELVAIAASEMARRFAAGGRLFTFGNGGSSTDATTLATLFARPPLGKPDQRGHSPRTRRSLPRWATTSGSSWCSRGSLLPARNQATLRSRCRPAAAPPI